MNPIVAVLIENVLPVVVTFLVPVLGVLAGWVLKKLKEKFGLDIASKQQEMLVQAIDSGIGLAEQWALSKLKHGEPRPAGAEKLDKALEFAIELAKKNGLDNLAKEELVKLLEARLGLAKMRSAE